jgi:hypothetical protein
MTLSKTGAKAIADGVLAEVRSLPVRGAQSVRGVRRRISARLKDEDPRDVLAIALCLRDTPLRWVGYESSGIIARR